MKITIGVDLGQANDHTALVVVGEHDGLLLIGHTQRLELGIAYPVMVETIAAMADEGMTHGPTTLVVDHTGVGRAVVDQLTDALPHAVPIIPVTTTAGARVTNLDGQWRVPKSELVGAAQVAFENRRIAVATDEHHSPDIAILEDELRRFAYDQTASGNVTFEGKGTHDDLVSALLLAVWFTERAPRPTRSRFHGAFDNWGATA